MIFRGSDTDWIIHSTLVDPPRPGDYWLRAAEKFAAGDARRFTLFDNWFSSSTRSSRFSAAQAGI